MLRVVKKYETYDFSFNTQQNIHIQKGQRRSGGQMNPENFKINVSF